MRRQFVTGQTADPGDPGLCTGCGPRVPEGASCRSACMACGSFACVVGGLVEGGLKRLRMATDRGDGLKSQLKLA